MSLVARPIVLLVALVTLAACSGGGDAAPTTPTTPTPPTPPTVASVIVSLSSPQLVAGSTTIATAETRSSTGVSLTGRAVSWSSSNPTVASVSNIGAITALTPGTTTIVATSEGQSGSAVLTVLPVPVAVVTVALAQATLTAGSSTVAIATLRSATNDVLTERPITWSSSDNAIATVSQSDTISSMSPGTATITAQSGSQSGSAVLTVTPPSVALVNVSLGAQSLQVGQTTTASAVARDAAGNVLTGRPVNWSSTTPSVASVSGAGVVTALAPGTTVISASIDGRVGTAALQVSTIGVASVTLSPSAISMVAGDLRLVVATVRDAAGNPLFGRQVNWFTSDNTVVDGAVSGDTALITGLRAGNVTLSVQVEGRTASIPVTVQVPTTNICSLIAGASVVGNDGRYLGRFTNRFDAESVLNEFGTYGSRFASNSTNNEFGTYGSRFSTLSARNPFTSTPPRIIRNGNFIAFYTVNEFLTPRVAPAFALTCTFP